MIGELDTASGDVVAALYEGLPGLTFRTSIRVAETVKYVDNAYHALKIAFANEIGSLLPRAKGLDSHEVMEIFASDTKLNISTAYLNPGFAFGGSCLPKDLRALLYAARQADLQLPLLESVLPSNERHLQRALDVLVALGRKQIGLFGLSFKQGTDDLRESPLVELSERLIGKGFDLRIYDPAVSLSALVGANREYIEQRIPHLSALLVSSSRELMDHADVCVIGAASEEAVHAVAARGDRIVFDLVRLDDSATAGVAMGTSASPGRALFLVENLSVPMDRRVWQECLAVRDAGFEVDVICPRGDKQDTEPFEVLEGSLDPPILPDARERRAGRILRRVSECGLADRGVRLVACTLDRPFRIVHAANPPDLLLLPVWPLKRDGVRFIFDQHDLCPELYLSRFGRGEGRPLPPDAGHSSGSRFDAADVVIATNESYRSVALTRGKKRQEDVFVVRSAPDLTRFRQRRTRPEPQARTAAPDRLPRHDGPAGRNRPCAPRARRSPDSPPRLARDLHRRRRRLSGR